MTTPKKSAGKVVKEFNKISQRLVVKLKDNEKAFLISKDQCYYLHHLTNLYEPFIIEVRRNETK